MNKVTQKEGMAGFGGERIGEACGVFGIYAPDLPVAQLTYQGLMALQHRGQEGAGIAVSDNHGIMVTSGQGRVIEAFNHGNDVVGLQEGIIAVGHTRYGTSASDTASQIEATQPMISGLTSEHEHLFSFSHNGHVEAASEVATNLGVNVTDAVSDSEIMHRVIEDRVIKGGSLESSLTETLPHFKGAYSLILSTPDSLIAARDPQGFRPLHLGKIQNHGWVVASEIGALDIVNADPVREIAPGEILAIDGIDTTALHSQEYAVADPHLCGFEFVYFSRPDNEMYGEVVLKVRERMGALLARRHPVEADMVIGVPESGVAGADGYSRESHIPHEKGLVRNLYVDRSFIAPSQNKREQAVRNKLNPIRRVIKGKRIVVVDDSIVRGTTQSTLVEMLRDRGAVEVHVRINSPPYKHPCFYGMDTGRPEELVASRMSINEIRDYIRADSLAYLEEEDMEQALGAAAGKVCTACTTGIYPVEIR